MPPTLSNFCVVKRKKGDKGKKERASKQKLSKGCHQGQNIIVLAILEVLELGIFLVSEIFIFLFWPTILFSVPCPPPLPFLHSPPTSYFEIHFAGPELRQKGS